MQRQLNYFMDKLRESMIVITLEQGGEKYLTLDADDNLEDVVPYLK